MRTTFSAPRRGLSPTSEGSAGDDEVARLRRAAFRVMTRDGFAGATVEAILTEAGLARRAFYRHFASKDELLLAMYRHEAAASAERIRAATTDGTPHERLRRWVEACVELLGDPRRAGRTLLLQEQAGRLRDDRSDLITAVVEQVVAPLREILEAGRTDGSFPATRPAPDAASVNAVLWEQLTAGVRAGNLDTDAVRDHVLRFCLPALEGRR